MASWYAIRTHHLQEERARLNLANQGYGTLLPQVRVEGLSKNYQPTVKIRPLFSRYLFVEVAEDQRWQPIMGTYGVVGFVGYYPSQPRPSCVRTGDMLELRRRIEAEGGMFRMGQGPLEVKPGVMVRVLFGPLRDAVGSIGLDCCSSRVEVLLTAAGMMSRARLPRECLAAA